MEDHFASLLVQVARLLRRNFDERMRALGVTRPQWQVLSVLKNHEGLNQRAAADLLEIEPITLARMVDRLAAGGLVERRPDPADRRAWRLYMTEKAWALLETMRPSAELLLAEATQGLSEDDTRQLARLLGHMRANLTQAIPPAG